MAGPFKLEVGQCYEINNRMMHSVANKGDTDRIHFIFDYVPADKRCPFRRLKRPENGPGSGLKRRPHYSKRTRTPTIAIANRG
jgi:hypothetical protein